MPFLSRMTAPWRLHKYDIFFILQIVSKAVAAPGRHGKWVWMTCVGRHAVFFLAGAVFQNEEGIHNGTDGYIIWPYSRQ